MIKKILIPYVQKTKKGKLAILKNSFFSFVRSLPSQTTNDGPIESDNGEVEEGVITTNGLPTWAGMRSVLADTNPKLMQVGFLPFLPYPVTDYSTVYTAMKNFKNIVQQLQQGRYSSGSKNKENIQIISRKYFIERAAELNKNIVLSSYVTDAEGIVSSEAILDNNVFSIEELIVDIEV